MHAKASTLSLLICLLCGGLIYIAPTSAQPAPSSDDPTITVFLVRHAEKVRGPGAGNDPALTEAGRARGRALAMTLSDADIDAIYTTQWRRTKETAADLAKRLGIEPVTVDTQGDFIERMRRLVAKHPGETLVIVGHSDTTPELARALGAERAPDISDNDFDDLYQVIITPGQSRFFHLRYGHPTP